jgi:phosphoglycerate kinase
MRMVNKMKSITDLNLENKIVLVRVDYNVPIEDGIVTDNRRIKESLKTIEYLLEKNNKIILFSHLGKIKTEDDKIKNDMKYVLPELSKALNKEVAFSSVTRGSELEEKISLLKPKEVLLVQNTRYEDIPNSLESNCDEELSKYWASLGDAFIMDAFGSAHRKHASTYGIGLYLETAIGFLMQKEMQVLDEIKNQDNKIIMLGGAKADDKIKMLKSLIPNSKYALIGGLLSIPFLKAIGKNLKAYNIDENSITEATNLLNEFKNKIILTLDFNVALAPDSLKQIKDVDYILDNEFCYDIGPKTVELFEEKLFSSTFIFWNGPVGLFENDQFKTGTKELIDLLSDFNAKVFLAGGDTSNAAYMFGYDDNFIVSTGGGASLEYLGDAKFPILELLESKQSSV